MALKAADCNYGAFLPVPRFPKTLERAVRSNKPVSEINKCLSLVHLTTIFRIQSPIRSEAKIQHRSPMIPLLYRLAACVLLVQFLLQLKQLAQLVRIGCTGRRSASHTRRRRSLIGF